MNQLPYGTNKVMWPSVGQAAVQKPDMSCVVCRCRSQSNRNYLNARRNLGVKRKLKGKQQLLGDVYSFLRGETGQAVFIITGKCDLEKDVRAIGVGDGKQYEVRTIASIDYDYSGWLVLSRFVRLTGFSS